MRGDSVAESARASLRSLRRAAAQTTHRRSLAAVAACVVVALASACSSAAPTTATAPSAPTAASSPAPAGAAPASPVVVPSSAPSLVSSVVASPSVSPVASPSAVASGPLTTVRVAVPNLGATTLPFFVGIDEGIFATYGLDVQVSALAPPSAGAALTSGEIDFMTGTSSAVQFIASGLPIRVVEVHEVRPTQVLIAAQGLTDVSQLKGKVIAEYGPGNAINSITPQLLSADGLQTSDYTVINAGDDPGRAAAVVSGQASATLLDTAAAFPLQQQGFPILARAADKVELPLSGLATTDSNLQTRRPFVKAVLQAFVDSLSATWSDKSEGVKVLQSQFNMDPNLASATYDDLKLSFSTDGRPSQQAIATSLQGVTPPLTADQVYDFSLLDEIEGPSAGS